MKKKRHLRKPVLFLLIGLLAAGVITSVLLISQKKKETEKQNLYDSLSVTVNENLLRVPYGSSFSIDSLIKEAEGDTEIEGTVDTRTTGEYPVTIRVSGETSYGEAVSKDYEYTVTVYDDTPPEITFQDERIEIRKGSELSLSNNIVSVTDEKDGVLSLSDTLSPGTYVIESDADPEEAGEYTVTIEAQDSDGNTAENSFLVIVNEANENQNPYRIMINRALNTVTVYAMDESGAYTLPVKAMVCSTGPATPAGVFHTFNRSNWRALFGGVYGQYATDIVGDILFHSVPYYSMNKGDLEYLEYNKLGTAASMGCIRLAVIDALWVFNNCPIGTEVEIYDDANNPGPLGKPESIYIDPDSEIRGWDPTDPDPNNPWNY